MLISIKCHVNQINGLEVALKILQNSKNDTLLQHVILLSNSESF